MKGIAALPASAEIRGIPVVADARASETARARGVWPLKSIVVGPKWFALDAEEQAAVLLHELYHCRRWHMEVRWLLFPVCWTRFARRIAREQEFAADTFAADEGYLRELVRYLARQWNAGAAPFHPTPWERISHLLQRSAP